MENKEILKVIAVFLFIIMMELSVITGLILSQVVK